MRKQDKFLSFLLFLSLVLIFYLLISSRPFKNKTIPDINLEKEKIVIEKAVDLSLIEDEYKYGAKELVCEYESLNLEDKTDMDEILNLQRRLLDLIVPAEYKKLHIDMLFALIRMEDYLNSNMVEHRNSSRNTISRIKGEYQWLNE